MSFFFMKHTESKTVQNSFAVALLLLSPDCLIPWEMWFIET